MNPNTSKKRWIFSVVDFDDHEEYVDERGQHVFVDDAVEFIGTASDAHTEADRRSELWEELNDCFASNVVSHSRGMVQ